MDKQQEISEVTPTTPTPVVEKKNNTKLILILVALFATCFVIILGVIAGIYLWQRDNNPAPITGLVTPTPVEVNVSVTPAVTGTIIPNNSSIDKFAYIDLNDENTSKDDEFWLMDANGKKTKLSTGEVSEVNNGGNKKWLVLMKYTDPNGLGNSIYTYNLTSGKTTVVPVTAVKDAHASVSLYYKHMSPDENWLIYRVRYYSNSNCDEMCPEIDPYPIAKNGAYAYNLNTQETVYLGEFLLSTWDQDNKHIIANSGVKYHEYDLENAFYRIDVATGKAEKLAPPIVNSYGDTRYYVSYPNRYLEYTTNSNAPSNEQGKLYLVDGVNKRIVDSSTFGGLQPFIEFSPDRTKAVYVNGNNMQIINTATGNVQTAITVTGTKPRLNVMFRWIDNNNVIYSYIENEMVYGKVIVAKVNLQTKVSTKLIDKEDIILHLN